ncbi:MAG: hypothetical protein Q7R98_01210 [Candidatus Jorgensenbacteria bacterium]|nr:hypothetical protein [Candidatus Jorgensenbacteria bacterium]
MRIALNFDWAASLFCAAKNFISKYKEFSFGAIVGILYCATMTVLWYVDNGGWAFLLGIIGLIFCIAALDEGEWRPGRTGLGTAHLECVREPFWDNVVARGVAMPIALFIITQIAYRFFWLIFGITVLWFFITGTVAGMLSLTLWLLFRSK